MKIKSMSQASIEYSALIYLYNKAAKESEDPNDDIELSFETLDNFIDRAKKEHELLDFMREFMTNLNGVLRGELQPKDIDERMSYLDTIIDTLEEELK